MVIIVVLFITYFFISARISFKNNFIIIDDNILRITRHILFKIHMGHRLFTHQVAQCIFHFCLLNEKIMLRVSGRVGQR